MHVTLDLHSVTLNPGLHHFWSTGSLCCVLLIGQGVFAVAATGARGWSHQPQGTFSFYPLAT